MKIQALIRTLQCLPVVWGIYACAPDNDTEVLPLASVAPAKVRQPAPSFPPGVVHLTTMRNYIFGHSLIVHAKAEGNTASDETTVPHWMYLLAKSAGYIYHADGQYGFLRQHSQLPPKPQWGFNDVQGVWGEVDDFAQCDYTTVTITAANFIQYQPATRPFDGDNPDKVTPLNETLKIVDWVSAQTPGIQIYIYENWPDMSSFVDEDAKIFNPTRAQFERYNAQVLSSFHAWWLAYQDKLLAARPDSNIKMIPVGPVISRLVSNTALKDIPVTDLYEDNAPHGKPTIYFLAGLISYMAMYGVQAPADFVVPDSIHPLVKSHYDEVVTFIWDELINFNNDAGQSRVW